jgi:hypothetical protein
MRLIIGLFVMLSLAACTNDSGSKPGKKYLFKTDRCADIAAEGSPEYDECRKKEAEEDAQKTYEMRRAVDAAPGWLPPTSIPSNAP